jgi:ATP-binding cassette subfamily C protein LapB
MDAWFIVAASVCIHAVALCVPLITMVVYDRVVPNHAYETLWTICAGALAIFLFDFVLRILRGRFTDVAGKRVDSLLSAGLVRQTLLMELSARPASSGTFAGKLRQYESVRDFLASASVVALVDTPVALMLTGLIFWLAGPVGWIPLGLSAAAMAVALLLQPFQRRMTRKSQSLSIDRQALASEVVNGLEAIKSANAEADTEEKMRGLDTASAQADLAMRRLNLIGNSFTGLCMNLTTLGVLVACVMRILDNSMTMGGMIACTMVAGRAMTPLLSVAGLLMRLQQTSASLRSLLDIMAMPREDDMPHIHPHLEFPELRLDKAGLTYPGQSLPSLRPTSLRIRPGERVGVIGRAGSGKTTLLRLLARLHLPTEGLVLMDGLDVRQISPSIIRAACGYLPQDPVLFHGSIRENIELGRRSHEDDAAFLKAAERAGLTEWVRRSPRGFDMPVGERGVLISGGQRQAVAAARTWLREPSVFLLDEPAANFDVSAEKHLRERLIDYLNENPRRTLVMATHKMSMLAVVDRVLVLDEGQVVADGPRDQVLAALQGREGADNPSSPLPPTP